MNTEINIYDAGPDFMGGILNEYRKRHGLTIYGHSLELGLSKNEYYRFGVTKKPKTPRECHELGQKLGIHYGYLELFMLAQEVLLRPLREYCCLECGEEEMLSLNKLYRCEFCNSRNIEMVTASSWLFYENGNFKANLLFTDGGWYTNGKRYEELAQAIASIESSL